MKHSRLQIVSTPMLVVSLMTLTFLVGPASGLASATVDVLYVTQPQATKASLATYDVNPVTGVASKVGSTITVGSSSVTPLSIGTKHLIYVWNATEVWTYVTNAEGVPNRQPSQHLTFGFPYPLRNFLADPNGKFAYAALVWLDSSFDANAEIVLLTIDQATGKLSNTNRVVARFGPDPNVTLTAFSFGKRGRKLWTSYDNSGGHSCSGGYDYYPVNQTNGQLGSLISSVSFDCTFSAGAVAISDESTASAQNFNGPGSGWVSINNLGTGQNIFCQAAMQTFCGDEAGALSLDPGGQNLFFADGDTGHISIGHMDWTNSTVVLSLSTIPGSPPLYFSPDSKLVYAVNATDIAIYALQSSSGKLKASTSLPLSGNVSVATATLH
jgi:hypothetical protein